MHIARHHTDKYWQLCEANSIVPNACALSWTGQMTMDASSRYVVIIFYSYDTNSSMLSQMSLNSIITHEPKGPKFTNGGLLDFIIELVVCEDEVCP